MVANTHSEPDPANGTNKFPLSFLLILERINFFVRAIGFCVGCFKILWLKCFDKSLGDLVGPLQSLQ